MATDFFIARLAAIEAQIVAYEAAILALGNAGATQSYRLDTGQSVTQVTRADLKQLNDTYMSLINQHTMISARCTGSNVIIARPAF